MFFYGRERAGKPCIYKISRLRKCFDLFLTKRKNIPNTLLPIYIICIVVVKCSKIDIAISLDKDVYPYYHFKSQGKDGRQQLTVNGLIYS